MRYIDALKLINVCIEHNILKEQDGCIFTYRNGTKTRKEGWYLTPKDILASELRSDIKGQEILLSTLKGMGINFNMEANIKNI